MQNPSSFFDGGGKISGDVEFGGDINLDSDSVLTAPDVIIEDSQGNTQARLSGEANSPLFNFFNNDIEKVSAVLARDDADNNDVQLVGIDTNDVVSIGDAAAARLDAVLDLNFPNITGAPSFGGHDHTEGGLNVIPNTGLSNSQITVNDNSGVSGGGAVSLGGTVGVSLDEAYNPTWTSAHTFNGGIDLGSDIDAQSAQTIINLPEPTNDGDASRKGYVDSVASGLAVQDNVIAATDGTNVDLASTTDPNPIDGVTVTDGERVLLKDQTDGTENGIYTANTATDPTTWARSEDFNEDSEVISGAFTFVDEGTVNADTSFVITTDDPITLGDTEIEWAIFTRAGDFSAGDGLNKDGQTFSVDEAYSFTWTGTHNFREEIEQQQIGTPAAPNAGDMQLYFKGDEGLYKQNPNGTEDRVGGLFGELVDLGTITLSTGSTPAFDGTLAGVSTDETISIDIVRVIPDSAGQVSTDYAWNTDYGRRYDDSQGEVDINLTVNWDTDPGSNITGRAFAVLR